MYKGSPQYYPRILRRLTMAVGERASRRRHESEMKFAEISLRNCLEFNYFTLSREITLLLWRDGALNLLPTPE